MDTGGIAEGDIREYTSEWKPDFAALADAIIVPNDGIGEYPVHAALLNSSVINGIVASTTSGEKPRIQVPASAITIQAILEAVYCRRYLKALVYAPYAELFRTFDFLDGCNDAFDMICDEIPDFVDAWASTWYKGNHTAEGLYHSFIITDATDVADAAVTRGMELERLTEVVIAFLTTPVRAAFFPKCLSRIIRILHDVSRSDTSGWITLMSHPAWDGVPGSVVGKFCACVNFEYPLDILLNPDAVTVTVPVILGADDFSTRTEKSIPLDPRWNLRCTNIPRARKEGNRRDPGHEAAIRLEVMCNVASGGLTRIEAEILGLFEPFNKLSLCEGGDVNTYYTNNVLAVLTNPISCEVKAIITNYL